MLPPVAAKDDDRGFHGVHPSQRGDAATLLVEALVKNTFVRRGGRPFSRGWCYKLALKVPRPGTRFVVHVKDLLVSVCIITGIVSITQSRLKPQTNRD
jgi:hypothetical protein